MIVNKQRFARRQFLRGAVTTVGALAAMPAMQGLSLVGANGRVSAARGFGGYGSLVPTPDLRDGIVRMALPEGFQYRSFSVTGTAMSDSTKVPLAPDGMGLFNTPQGHFRLVRNHEDRNSPGNGTTALLSGLSYDMKGGGGTTTLVVNPFTRELERDFVSLSGTIVNCAGGVTPWGSWITCEETNAGPTPSTWQQQHGYCFEVPASAEAQVPALPIREMGRFAHEAVAVDPATGIIYETEDNSSTSGFYRFIPHTPGVLLNGGRLEMLRIVGVDNYDTRAGQTQGVELPAAWVPIDDPDPPGTSSTAVYNQGRVRGGARFGRLEGCWYGHGAIYFCSTSGGNAGRGQVWEFRPEGDTGILKMIYESPSAAVLDSPDNLTVSPQGALLLCEDGGGEQYLRGVTLDGTIFDFALNLMSDAEWAGAVFAEADAAWNDHSIRGEHPPLGNRWERVTLFANIMGPTSGPNPPSAGDEGMTFAIWGPWKEGAL
jgi:secreted PhoX family phosphatase